MTSFEIKSISIVDFVFYSNQLSEYLNSKFALPTDDSPTRITFIIISNLLSSIIKFINYLYCII